jgi:hypothetical protein
MNAKQSIAFPEVAIIHKGKPKKKTSKGGWGLGPDLLDRFRIDFQPGTEQRMQPGLPSVVEIFEAAYCSGPNPAAVKVVYGPDYAKETGYEAKTLMCMVTTKSVFESFEWGNEAYSAGARVALANEESYELIKNPANLREYIVRNGEPYREFTPGDTIDYERNGQKFSLPVKPFSRLRLYFPGMNRLVYFTLKTVSFYDRENIKANLSAIQLLANTLNNGNAAGIPLLVYRREQDVVWNKPDGSAVRLKKKCVFIEAHPDWVKEATSRLGNFALSFGQMLALSAPVELSSPVDPTIDAETDEAPPEPPEADSAEEVIEGEETQPEPEEDLTDLPKSRPYAPEMVRQKIAGLVERYQGYTASDKQVQLLAMSLNEIFVGDEAKRKALTYYLVGVESAAKMNGAQVNALLFWLALKKADTGEYVAEKLSRLEANACYTQAMKEQGQGELPL